MIASIKEVFGDNIEIGIFSEFYFGCSDSFHYVIVFSNYVENSSKKIKLF